MTMLFGLAVVGEEPCFPEEPPSQNKLVFELYDDFINDSEAEQLNAKLVQFARETSNQIVVLIVNDLCGYDPARYAFDIGEKWKVGQSEFDNGVVVLVKPTGGKGQRKTFIAVGYGLEPVIPDLTAKRIVDKELIGNFKQGANYQGLDAATDVLMGLAVGEFDHGEYGKDEFPVAVALAIMAVFLLMFIGFIFSVRKYANTNNIAFWTAMMLMSQNSRSHGGTFGGGGGFSGGGGFGGFGGGSFGGGGAGGSW